MARKPLTPAVAYTHDGRNLRFLHGSTRPLYQQR